MTPVRRPLRYGRDMALDDPGKAWLRRLLKLPVAREPLPAPEEREQRRDGARRDAKDADQPEFAWPDVAPPKPKPEPEWQAGAAPPKGATAENEFSPTPAAPRRVPRSQEAWAAQADALANGDHERADAAARLAFSLEVAEGVPNAARRFDEWAAAKNDRAEGRAAAKREAWDNMPDAKRAARRQGEEREM